MTRPARNYFPKNIPSVPDRDISRETPVSLKFDWATVAGLGCRTTQPRKYPVQAIRNLARWLLFGPVAARSNPTLVRSVKEVNGACDPWERRILDLADGNSPGQVAEYLYRDELAKGAHLADIGIWKNLFDRSVADDISRLVSEGYLSVRGDDEP